MQKVMGRRLSVEMGGAKRLHALSLLVLSALFAPWAFVHLLASTVRVKVYVRKKGGGERGRSGRGGRGEGVGGEGVGREGIVDGRG